MTKIMQPSIYWKLFFSPSDKVQVIILWKSNHISAK